MPKLSPKQPIKEKIAKINTKLQQTSKHPNETSKRSLNAKTKIKNIKASKLPQIKFKIKINLKKKQQPEPEPAPLAKTLPKGTKSYRQIPTLRTIRSSCNRSRPQNRRTQIHSRRTPT